mmetsp:Transcript_4477/g.10556  ORF Transcript_4477/g.10556 Transcript_4477/m.10556 type:complete len:155 (-) Transcript_4477:884-1348(-)
MDEAGWNTPRSSRRRRRRRKHKSALKEGRNNVASQSTQHIFVKTSRSTKFSAEDANEILAKDDDLREYCKRLWGFNRNRWPQVQFWPVLIWTLDLGVQSPRFSRTHTSGTRSRCQRKSLVFSSPLSFLIHSTGTLLLALILIVRSQRASQSMLV